MTSTASSPEQYLEQLPEDRKEAVRRLREVIKSNLPPDFEEVMNYGMIGFVVPHKVYSPGYHCDPKLPLPFAALASQKNFIAFYHMGIYAMPELLTWFTSRYSEKSKNKLDMGKSCIRFKKPESIPYDLIGELMSKLTAAEWIRVYESNIKK